MNSTTIYGHLGRQPEMAYSPTGTAMTKTSVAVTRKWGKGEARKEETTWFNVTAFQQTAEAMSQYCSKGDPIILVGRVSTHAYTDKDGKPAASLDLTVESMTLVASKKDGNTTAAEPTDGDFPF